MRVSTESQLRVAVSALRSNTTIEIAPGTYSLTDALYVNGTFTNVGIRGATSSSDDVVLVGAGMNNPAVPFGIWVGGDVRGVTIANLTIRDVYYHNVMLNAGTQSPWLYNLRLVNAGQQIVKANPTSSGGGVDNGIVEYSIIEYVTTSKDYYTNGVDVHTGRNWIIRHNLFRNIRAPQGQLAGPALLMWNKSSGTLAEGNTFIDCQREIAFGLIERSPDDHSGGIVRNNFIYRSPSVAGDTAIGVFDSPNTQVLHNTILASRTYPSLIEYRFAGTLGAVIANNLLDGTVLARDGARATVSGNVTTASADMFVGPATGDLRLKPTASAAIDRASTLADWDWEGTPRPQGTAADVGADEYGAGAGPTAPRNLRISTELRTVRLKPDTTYYGLQSFRFHHQTHVRLRLTEAAFAGLPADLSVVVCIEPVGNLLGQVCQLIDERLTVPDTLRLQELSRRRDRFIGPFRNVLEGRGHMGRVRLHVLRRAFRFRRELNVLQRSSHRTLDPVTRTRNFDLQIRGRQTGVGRLERRIGLRTRIQRV